MELVAVACELIDSELRDWSEERPWLGGNVCGLEANVEPEE